jgi:hypothetical protein
MGIRFWVQGTLPLAIAVDRPTQVPVCAPVLLVLFGALRTYHSQRRAYGTHMAKWVTRSDLYGYPFAASILCSEESAAANMGQSRTVDDQIQWLTCDGELVAGDEGHRCIHRNGVLVGFIDLTNRHPPRTDRPRAWR